MHAVGHSTGLVLYPVDVHGEWSFRVADAGQVVELGGWGYAGPVDLDGIPNPPPGALCVHTVAVPRSPAADDPNWVTTMIAVRGLIDAHLERYRACQVWAAAGLPRDLVDWISTGCPSPLDGLDAESEA